MSGYISMLFGSAGGRGGGGGGGGVAVERWCWVTFSSMASY